MPTSKSISQNSPESGSLGRLFDVLRVCGDVHEPKAFVEKLLSELQEICPYDLAIVYFLNENGKIYDRILVNCDDYWASAYIAYFSKVDNRHYSVEYRSNQNHAAAVSVTTQDWTQEESAEFIPNFIRLQGLKYGCGFGLRDLNGRVRVSVGLNRTQDRPYAKEELMSLQLLYPHLSNLFKNFFYQDQLNMSAVRYTSPDIGSLSARETQVVNLLCQGVTPSNISRILHISPSTANKHIAHIYKKLNISSKQELLVRMLGQQET